jgi:hypothetical protein
VDVTFWVIQALLLTPVLFMAASVGMEERPNRGRLVRPRQTDADASAAPALGTEDMRPTVAAPRIVAAAVAGLSQFSAEQQARLVVLRSFVQEARSGHGALSDDLVAAAPDVSPVPNLRQASWRPRRPGNQQLMMVGGVLLMTVGLVGVVRTSMAMDDLQRNSVSQPAPLTPAARLLPGLIVSPAKYLSAVNGAGGGGNSSRVDPFYAVGQMELKQSMDRWEALAGVGLSLLLFGNAMRIAAASASDEEDTSVAIDFAPFVLVAAVLFAMLSFFELP